LGFDYLRLTPSRNEPITTAVAQYASLDALIEGLPPTTMYGFAPGGASLIEIASAFAQDSWSAGQRLNLTYGLRWEYMPPPASRVLPAMFVSTTGPITGAAAGRLVEFTTIPTFFAVPEWNARFGRVAPRAGLAYRLSRSGDWVLRAGIGTFYDLGFASAIDPLNAVPFNSWRTVAGPVVSASVPNGPQYGFASDLRIPYSWQWNLTLEGTAQSVGIISAAWVGSRGNNLLRREGYQPAVAARFPAVILATSHGQSHYHAFPFHFLRTLPAR